VAGQPSGLCSWPISWTVHGYETDQQKYNPGLWQPSYEHAVATSCILVGGFGIMLNSLNNLVQGAANFFVSVSDEKGD
jgi:hypothetical protein